MKDSRQVPVSFWNILPKSSLLISILTLIVWNSFHVTFASESSDFEVYRHGEICIDAPWAYDSLGKTVGAAFMVISAREGFSDVLLSAKSPQAEKVTLHDTVIKNGIVAMNQVQDLSFDAKSPLIFKPHGLHVMLGELESALISESQLQIELNFKDSGPVNINISIRALSDGAPEHNLVCD